MRLADLKPGMRVRRVSSRSSFVPDGPATRDKPRRELICIEILRADASNRTPRARCRIVGTEIHEIVQVHRLEPVPSD